MACDSINLSSLSEGADVSAGVLISSTVVFKDISLAPFEDWASITSSAADTSWNFGLASA